MKISIITVAFNSEKYIQTAIESVLNQDYNNVEYIIIDGNSTDRTLSIINEYKDKINILVSEPDKGIYDAMNKGLKLASGDVIATLNSDDMYIDNTILSKVAASFAQNNCDIIYGNLYYVKSNDTEKIVRKWITKPFKKNAFKKGWHPPHPTFFVRKNIYLKYGYFNLGFKLAADFELMLRFLENHAASSFYMNIPMVKMRLGGATNKNLKNIINQNFECYNAFKKNNLPVSVLYPLYRLLPKLFQFK